FVAGPDMKLRLRRTVGISGTRAAKRENQGAKSGHAPQIRFEVSHGPHLLVTNRLNTEGAQQYSDVRKNVWKHRMSGEVYRREAHRWRKIRRLSGRGQPLFSNEAIYSSGDEVLARSIR
ncbi:MAG: hypothetical protein ACOYM8_12615, partial [Caulobacterales bacterium]